MKQSNLPELTKQNKQREASFGLKLREWVEKNYKSLTSCTFETKDTRGENYMKFSEITQDQINNGLRTKSDKGNLVRISTGTPGAADYNYHRKAPAYLIIKFPKGWEMIDIETFALEAKRSKRRSLTHARAKEISILSVGRQEESKDSPRKAR